MSDIPASIHIVEEAPREGFQSEPAGIAVRDELRLIDSAAGLEPGVARFDASCGGHGGCAFADNKAAAGSIATEELVLPCDRLGMETGVDNVALIEAARLAREIVGHPLAGKLVNAELTRRHA